MTRATVAYYGDDFTGSVDVLLQFARRGLAGRLFTQLPSLAALRDAAEEVDVVGIAGIARSLAVDAIADEVAPVFGAFRRLGVPVVQYKACSTADSSPSIGSIGRVLEAARAVFGPRAVPMLFAQPDFGRYTVFGHHFAREGDTVYRLDRQPTMSRHPTTPMREAELATHFALQTSLPIGAVPFVAYTSSDALAELIAHSPEAALVLDASTDEEVDLVGRAVLAQEPPVFALGSGGLSAGLARASGSAAVTLRASSGATGPVLAVSGSRSPQTRRQVDAAAAAGWMLEPLALESGQADRVAASLSSRRSVVLTSDDADVGAGDGVLERIAEAAASVVSHSVRAGATRRIIVCGGDTSSRVTRLLGVESLSIAANPMGNVVLLRAHAQDAAVDGLELLLKGGQVGPVDLFEQVRTGSTPGR
ncbi:four-carbon acid sugar kinase family protein [Microbacterium sp. SS28]|uniref:four-carbon acid sugar kinase family protein n=1 Tax=Microbacterium sp. SS28 TaxID=2919948 RepID=UPI001FAAB595|nr:four-carbon acid sugar kinase family protein [Microbacterium sp. SS28]